MDGIVSESNLTNEEMNRLYEEIAGSNEEPDEQVISLDDIENFDGYDVEDDERDSFSKTFTFPIEKKKAIISYLKKHQNEIVEKIIQEAEKE